MIAQKSGYGFTSTVLSMMLFVFFALLSLLQVLYGARVYSDVVAGIDDGYALRASLNYATNKLHAHDGCGPVRTENVNGLDVLCLWDEKEEYVTCMYFTDGYLMEQYMASSSAFIPSAGQRIAELADFTFDVSDSGGVTFTAWTWEGTMRSVSVYQRAGGTVK